MPTIKSDLTSKTISGPKYRELEVSDESNTEYPDFNEMNERMAARGLPPISEDQFRRMFDAQMRSAPEPKQSYQAPGPSLEETEQYIKEMRIAKATGKTRLSEGAKRRVLALCDMLRETRDVMLGDVKFSLRTLKDKEMRTAIISSSNFDGTVESPFEIRKQILSRSIFSINDTDIAVFLGVDNLESKLEFIEEMDEKALDFLYDEYLKLNEAATAKYAIKGPEDLNGLVEDIKK